jgi:hypothetical protein
MNSGLRLVPRSLRKWRADYRVLTNINNLKKYRRVSASGPVKRIDAFERQNDERRTDRAGSVGFK